jgi:hypothetical protein
VHGEPAASGALADRLAEGAHNAVLPKPLERVWMT